MSVLRDIGGAVLWVAVALVVAVGAAGIVTGVGGAPGTAARPEMTWAGDRELLADLGESTGLIGDLSDEVTALGDQGRLALAALAARDIERAQAAVDAGSGIAARIVDMAADLAVAAEAMPGGEPLAALRYAPDLRAQRSLVGSAAGTTDGIEATWGRFTVAAIAAERLATLLTQHDEQTGQAAAHGSKGRYDDALAALDNSDAMIAEIDRLHDELAAAADTTILAAWIDRHRDYDAALRTLYGELVRSNGRATPAVRAALEAEQKARGLLPVDTRALTVVMEEVARGGLQQAVIAIVEASTRLEDIRDRLDAEAAS
jgi:hypothetical protein